MSELNQGALLAQVSHIDLFVFIILFVSMFGVALWSHRRTAQPSSGTNSQLEYLLMGRRLTLPLFVATLVATWYGGIFGVTQIAFESGIYNFVTQGVFWYITYILFAVFLVKKVRSTSAKTLPELAGQLFGPRAVKVAGFLNFFNVLPIAYAASIGILLHALFGLDAGIWTVVGVGVVCLYSIFGGFRAVVLTDVVQFFLMCLAVFLVIVFSVSSFGGMDYLQSNLPKGHFSPLGEHSLATTLVWGLIALSTLVDPNFYQRCFAASSAETAKKGILLSTIVWVLFDLCTTFGAMYAFAYNPAADSGQAYLSYAIAILPEGIKGLFLAGIAATILSTLDSYLFVAGTTIHYDLAPKRLRESRWIRPVSIAFVGALAFTLSQAFEGNVRLIWKTLGSLSAGSLLVPFLYGYARRGSMSDKGFCATVIVAALSMALWRNLGLSGWTTNVDEIYIGIAVGLGSVAWLELANWGSVSTKTPSLTS